MINKSRYLIGIDPGTKTGLALYDRKEKKLVLVQTMHILDAMGEVLNTRKMGKIFIRIEDARKRKWFGVRSNDKLQGAGSIKRDVTIWEEFCDKYGIQAEFLEPAAGTTKWSAEYFQKLTGWKERTSNHARDAAALVYGF